MAECGNVECSDHDVEYPGNCSHHWRHNCNLCPRFKVEQPPDPNRYAEAFKIATMHLDSYEHMHRNGCIVRKFKQMISDNMSAESIVAELEKMI